ncbi:SMC-Scp complex subunit ScpB [Isoptericola variabilis]|uniref:Chromosome segregation and condensation protein, ScpB n=1 Tax=Isoptericola variabilis (strain 225) TaxID=743718 RepID=F6FUD4_ISOV2|nr:SMC-Scp complex subunit ScpB [Isoptericola variabilis]AEG44262.1 chromosome segregation and condensation protein, ScpB [Isoptericola variabilis 225]
MTQEPDDRIDTEAGVEPGVEVDVASLPGGAAAALEAVLMVAESPVPVERLAAAVDLPVPRVRETLEALAAEYRGDGDGRPRGFELREGAEGWRFYSSRAHADVVGRFVLEGQSSRLSQAALETLAVIAYRQPVTRGQVSAVRGVNVDGVVRTLLARGLIAETGQDPMTGAALFGTTGEFLDRMGWSSLDELPPLAPHLPGVEEAASLGIDD